jgi:hypothetical protein
MPPSDNPQTATRSMPRVVEQVDHVRRQILDSRLFVSML